MHRTAMLAALLVACTGGPLDTIEDTGDTGQDTADTSDTTDSDTVVDTDDAADDADAIYEDCDAAAAGATKLAPGNFNGTTDNWNDSFDEQCVIGGPGPDKVFAIDVPADTRLVVDFRIQGNNAKIFLLDACETSAQCTVYADTQAGNASEHLTWANTGDETVTQYVVLDSLNPAEDGETWTLAVALQPYTVLALADTCSGLGALTPITATGAWDVSMTGLANDYDAAADYSCTGDSSAGVDGVVPVTLVDGATISVTWSSPICDASVYLLESCGDFGTCMAGEDLTSSGGDESFTWTNSTGHDGTFTLVLDHYKSLSSALCAPSPESPGSLEVTISPPLPVGADACLDAEALSPVTPGTYYILTGTAGDDLDLADAADSCTGQTSPGDDVFVPVSVPDGQELRARYTTGDGQAALYVVTDCADADSCVVGIDEGATQEVRSINTSGATADVFMVVDSRYPDGHASEPSSGLLEVAVQAPLGDIPLADACADLPTTPKVGEGTHVIVMDDFINNIDLGAGNQCTGWSSIGVDGMVQVRVRKGWTLDVNYTAGCDSSLYLLTACSNGTCLDGSDSAFSSGPEHVNWKNETTGTVDVIVVMDAYSACKPTRNAPAALAVDLIPPPSVAADTCAAALAKPPVTAGIYEIDLTDASPDQDASTLGGCGGVAASAGDEVYVPITLEPSQWVHLSFDPDAGDPSMYLLQDCDTTPVCLDGVDDGNPELLSWLNDSDSPTTFVAVLDTNAADGTVDEPQSGSLEVSFQYEITPLAASDTCGAAPLTAAGHYSIDLTGFANDLDLADAVAAPCTDGQNTPGHDAFVDVDVPAGSTVDLEWDASISTSGITNGSIYLLSACNVDACLVGSDAGDPESISYTNSTGSTQSLTVGVDARSTSGVGGPNKGILTVAFTP